MHKSILQTIKDTAKALKVGVAPEVARWALVKEGWEAKRANIIVRWAQQLKSANSSEDKGNII
jgi:hypothetical protein